MARNEADGTTPDARPESGQRARRSRRGRRSGDEPAATSLTERAVETIRDRILDLTLRPGSRIDEKMLMRQFKLSRTPAREAFNRLVTEGLVEMQANKGTYVRPLDVGQISVFFDAYHIGERMIAYFCRLPNSELADRLESIQREHEAAVRDRDYLDITCLNAKFHTSIAKATGNEFICDFSTRLHNHARRLSFLVYRMELDDPAFHRDQERGIVSEHNRIVAAIRQGDRAELIDVMGRHARRFQQRITRFVDTSRGLDFPIGD